MRLVVEPHAKLGSLRSLLFAPGSDQRKLERALASPADAVIADLEDAVTSDRKDAARSLIARAFTGSPSRPARLLRINAPDTPYFEDDLALARRLPLDAVVLPKATPSSVQALEGLSLPVLAIVESAAGVRLAYEIASCTPVFALLLGAADLGAELGLETRADGFEIQYMRSKLVVDSAAAGIRPPFDVVRTIVHDAKGLGAEAELARSLGLRGKACIHPEQVPVVNRAFTPSADEVSWAEEIVRAASAGELRGVGAIQIGGSMIDAPLVARARRVISESQRSETT